MISNTSIRNVWVWDPFHIWQKGESVFICPGLSKAGRSTFSRHVALLLRKELLVTQSHLLFLLLSDEQSILPCKKEELQCGDGLCLLNWLRCHYKKDCGRDYMSIKLTCSSELAFTFLNHDLQMWICFLTESVFVAIHCSKRKIWYGFTVARIWIFRGLFIHMSKSFMLRADFK